MSSSFQHTVVDLSRGRGSAGSSGGLQAPNFFVLHSNTSLFAGVPHVKGKLNGPADIATFHSPQDIVLDKNQQLFVADTRNSSIRRINKDGKVSTIASISGGDGPVENEPHGLAFDHKNNMYILQSGIQHHIFKISQEGSVTQLAGANKEGHQDVPPGGDFFKAQFSLPRATGVDSRNRLYICDQKNNAIRRIDCVEKSITTLLDADGKPLDLLYPEGIVVDQFDDIYVADTGHHRIMKISPREIAGRLVNIVTNYTGKYGVPGYENGENSGVRLNRPTGLAIDKQNHLWICDSGNNCIRMFSHKSEFMFTISGKGSDSQDHLYSNPTSIALSYDPKYGAELAASTPDAVRNNPNHPLYYSYITPVGFVADSEAHCIRKIHSILMEPAQAFIDVFNNDPSDDYPLHNALAYGDMARRDELVRVLLHLRPQLLQQKDKKGRLPIHIAAMESATVTAGSISLTATIQPMLRQAVGDCLSELDGDGCNALHYALQQMALHSFNEAALKIESTPDEPSAATAYSRALITHLLMLSPSSVTQKCNRNFSLHWFLFQGFPLKVLKKVAAAYEDSADSTSLPSGAAGRAEVLPSPFLVRDQNGRLPLHMACMLQGAVGMDVVGWLVDATPNVEALRTRDGSLLAAAMKLNPKVTLKEVGVPGHYPLWYAATNQTYKDQAEAARLLHSPTPLYSIPPSQQLLIEHLLTRWPQMMLETEGGSILAIRGNEAHSQFPPAVLRIHKSGAIKPPSPTTATFLDWVFYMRGLELLRLLLKHLPSVSAIDALVWEAMPDAKGTLTATPVASLGSGRGGPPPANMLSMLHVSALVSDADLVSLLLQQRANPFQEDTNGRVPLDHATDPLCIQLLTDAMARDPRKPPPPPPKVVEVVKPLTFDQESQTASGDSVLESARRKLAHREDELREEIDKLTQLSQASKQDIELERVRLREREEHLARQAESAADEARQRSEQALLAKTLELAATQQRMQEELEAERSRMRAREAESIRQSDALLNAQRQKMEAELLAQSDEKFRAQQSRMTAELEAERSRLNSKFHEQTLAADKQRTEARARFEAELSLAADERLNKELARVQGDIEQERQRLREREAELTRTAEHEANMARIRLEHEFASKTQQLTTTSARLTEALEAERAALAVKQEELARELEHERTVVRIRMEHELRAGMEASIAAQRTSMLAEVEDEQKRLREKEEALARDNVAAKAAMKSYLESELAARAHESTRAAHERLMSEFEQMKREAALRESQAYTRMDQERALEKEKAAADLQQERAKHEAAALERMRELERERADMQARFESLEDSARAARDLAAVEAGKAFQAQLERERDRLSAAFAERARMQDTVVEQEIAQARALLEEQKARWEEQLRLDRAKLHDELDARRAKLEADETARLQRIANEDRDRRLLFESDRDTRASNDARERAEQARRDRVERDAARALDMERTEKFALAERERAARWEAEEAARLALRAQEATRFDAERAQLLAEFEAYRRRSEEEHAARLSGVVLDHETTRARTDAEHATRVASLLAEVEHTKKRLEDDHSARLQALLAEVAQAKAAMDEDHAARAALETVTLENIRVKCEHEKAELRRSLEAHFEAEKGALQARAHDEALELQRTQDEKRRAEEAARDEERRRVDGERLRLETAREEDRRREEERYAADRERMRAELEQARAADEETLAHERRRLEQERTKDLERLEQERGRLEAEREELHRRTHAEAEALRRENAMRAAEEEVREAQRGARDEEEQARLRAAADAREAAHRRALAEREDAFKARMEQREASLKAAEDLRLQELMLRLRSVEEDLERTRRELELQIAEKHLAKRGVQERQVKVLQLERHVEKMSAVQVQPAVIRYTNNPLDVDPCTLPLDDLHEVATSVASFARDFQAMSFRALLSLLLSIPTTQLNKSSTLLRIYLATHHGVCAKADEAGFYPLHLAAQTGLVRELTDILVKEHPAALKTDDKNGVHAVFYAARGRKKKERVQLQLLQKNDPALVAAAAAAAAAAANGASSQEEQKEPSSNGQKAITDGSSVSASSLRRQGLELVRYFISKQPDSIYLPNNLRPVTHAQPSSSSSSKAASGNAASAIAALAASGKKDASWNEKLPTSTLGVALQLYVDSTPPPSGAASLSVVEWAVETQDLDLLTLLHECTSGEFLNAVDSLGRSYLHRAAAAGKMGLCKWLVEVGQVSPWLLCNHDRTPLEYVDKGQGRANEELALYLTREMTKVAPERRVKRRRGGQRLLMIREWADGEQPASVPAPVSSKQQHRLIGDASADESVPVTPRGSSLGPVKSRSKVDLRSSDEYETPRKGSRSGHGGSASTSKKLTHGSATHTTPTSTTHIHVYPSMPGVHGAHVGDEGGLDDSLTSPSRSLGPIRALGSGRGGNVLSPYGAPLGSPAKVSSKPSSAQEADYDEMEVFASQQNGERSGSPGRRRIKGYHWDFLKSGSSHSQLLTHAGEPKLAPAGQPAYASIYASAHERAHSRERSRERNTGRSPSPVRGGGGRERGVDAVHTLSSLQATTENLQQLLVDLRVTSQAQQQHLQQQQRNTSSSKRR